MGGGCLRGVRLSCTPYKWGGGFLGPTNVTRWIDWLAAGAVMAVAVAPSETLAWRVPSGAGGGAEGGGDISGSEGGSEGGGACARMGSVEDMCGVVPLLRPGDVVFFTDLTQGDLGSWRIYGIPNANTIEPKTYKSSYVK